MQAFRSGCGLARGLSLKGVGNAIAPRALATSSHVMGKETNLHEMQAKSSVKGSDKWILSTFGPDGKYASSKDVPDHVNTSEIDRAKSRLRIYLNTLGMLAVLFAAAYYIRWGKLRQIKGETLENTNLAKKQALKDAEATN